MPTLPRAFRLLPLLAMLLLLGMALSSSVQAEEVVYFNTDSLKYHCMTCRWAVKCTKNCVRMKKSEAEERGTPCKVCHGSCGE
ncbi:MAG TPA: hypothetical protein VJ885_16420 [Thermoanaerobaculia bacterium]|nr:hypothetical protein [Thermoanaerobaculia bacterium]